MYPIFDFFIRGDWRFETKKINSLIAQMSEAEREDFDCDQSKINWTEYIALFVRGMSIWILKEDNVAPKHYLQ
jgi:hypothetical protein